MPRLPIFTPSPAVVRFVEGERREQRLPPPRPEPPRPGADGDAVRVPQEAASVLAGASAIRLAELSEPDRVPDVCWIDGESQLAVRPGNTSVQLLPGTVVVRLAVRCDQTGEADVFVTFAVGEDERPAGLYAATPRRPRGPELVVETWGEALTAFAWHVLLDVATGVAAAVGADEAGQPLVPAELRAQDGVLVVMAMARHRFTRGKGVPV
jgi:hypothetical protein